MNWALAIKQNQELLLRIVAGLLIVAGFNADGRLPQRVRVMILGILRPAEAAARRLVAIVARDVVIVPVVGRKRSVAVASAGLGERRAVFRLIDLRKNFGWTDKAAVMGPGPRLSVPGLDDPALGAVPLASGDCDSRRLLGRVEALHRALDDLPGQALRLARMRTWSKRKVLSPLRPGMPPGYRKRRWTHPVYEVLDECHRLARYALDPPLSIPGR